MVGFMALLIYGVVVGKYQVDLLLVVFASAIVLFFIFISQVVRRSIKFLRRTGEVMEKIAQGEYQFTIKTSRIRELDAMADQFVAVAQARKMSDMRLYEREQNLEITLNSIADV